MNAFLKLLLVHLCCAPLLITDAMAREVGRGGGGRASASKPSSRQMPKPTQRPTVRATPRPATQVNRNPITQSKMPKPSAKPAPQYRPQTKPSTPQKPTAKPNSRPSVPSKPATRPDAKPNPPNRPTDRPTDRPADRPTGKPQDRPGNNQASRPNNPNRPGEPSRPSEPTRPGANQPGKNDRPLDASRPLSRPSTKPGNVNYPGANRPNDNRPNNNRPNDNRPGTNRPQNQQPGNNLANRPGSNRPVVSKPGQNSRPIKKPDFNQPTASRPGQSSSSNWWNSGRPNNRPNNRPGVNINNNNNQFGNNVHINNNNIHINNNFKNNVNWSTNRKNWGYNPWWNRPATRPWYGGSWNCGWNNSYYRKHYHHHHYYGGYRPLPGYVVYQDNSNDVAQAIGWGLVGWSLGKLIFDSGYQTYTNPYPAQPVPSSTGSQVTYTQPITVVAAQTAPSDEQAAAVTEISESHMVSSQEAFKQQNYLLALEGANKAVGEAPGDGALHEYRALVLFSLGKFSEAAGVLNPVLAGGPGWDWTTMISLYPSQEAYMTQLAALESYVKSKPDAADARFLLGYHYMVCGHLEQANAEFANAARLQPADSVSSQLRDLTAASSNNGDDDAVESTEPAAGDEPAPVAPVPLEKLTGTWVSDKGAQGTVSLAFMDEGKFIWTFRQGEKSNEFGGDFSINDNGLLVLDAEESQMVATVELPTDGELKFVLAGGPPGDPGLLFARK